MTRARRHLFASPLPWLLALYALLSLGYGWVNPVFEAPDEYAHFYTALAVRANWRLPTVSEPPDPYLGQEAAQPPLYYILAALLMSPFDVNASAARNALWLNPFVRLGDPSTPVNRNAVVSYPGERAYAPAVHGLRLFSATLGLITLASIYGTARRLWPERPERAVLATGLVAVLPQFDFLHAYVNNDVLVIALTSFALYQMVVIWQAPGYAGWRLVGLGGTVGLAMLSKAAGLLLLAYALGVIGVRHWQRFGRIRFIAALAAVSLPALALSGWLLWRNWSLYGDLTATAPFIRLAGGDRHYTLSQALAETSSLWRSSFGVFGWFNVQPADWFHAVWKSLAALALSGGLLHLLIRRPEKAWLPWLLAGWPLIVLAGLLRFMQQTPAAQGRLLLPAVLPLALGVAYGLSAWLDRFSPGRRRLLIGLVLAVGLATTVYGLFGVIRPAYARPQVVAVVPPQMAQFNRALGEGVELVGAQLDTSAAQPGDIVWLDLVWRAQTPPSRAPEVVVEIFGRPRAPDEVGSIGRIQAYHGGGLYPANLWPAGAFIQERLGIPLRGDVLTPTQGRVNVRLVDGEQVDVGNLKVTPPIWPVVTGLVARLGPAIEVARVAVVDSAENSADTVHPGDTLTLHIVWRVTAAVNQDFTTFVHFGRPGAPPLAQGDSPPLAGFYPTHWWATGEQFADSYRVTVPADVAPGAYTLQFGLYDANLQRLPARDAADQPLGDKVTLTLSVVDN